MHVATVGAAFAANKGAASMLQAIIDRAPAYLGVCDIHILTPYPRGDSRWAAQAGVRAVPWRPAAMVAGLPIALIVALLRRFRLPTRWLCHTRALRTLHDADVVIDASGISFADGRGIATLVYNVLLTATPLLLGAPTVKASQALGPFGNPVNRAAAKVLLPHLSAVCARGSSTLEHLSQVGIPNAIPAADLTFQLEVYEPARRHVQRLVSATTQHSALVVAVIPSQVVATYCSSHDIDYVDILAQTVNDLTRSGARIIVVPHAWRPNTHPGRMNDRPVCRQVARNLHQRGLVTLVDEDLSPHELRALVEFADIALTSRFHAMISALCSLTPPVVVGWSHKYGEVLDSFGLPEQAISYRGLTKRSLTTLVQHTITSRDELRERIGQNLPAVRASAARNLECVATAARSPAPRP